MQTHSTPEDHINSSAASMTVAMTLLTGFTLAVTGITIASAALAIFGTIIMFGGAGLYRLLLV